MTEPGPSPAACPSCGAPLRGAARHCVWCGSPAAAPPVTGTAPPGSWTAPPGTWTAPPGTGTAPPGSWTLPPASPTAQPAGYPSAYRAGPSAYAGPVVASPPPGWYPDPCGRYRYRYWDGRDWTEKAYSTVLAIDPVPGRPAVTPSPIFRGGDGLVVLAMAGLVVPFGLGALAEWGWISLHGPGGGYALEVIFSVVLWTGMIATCLFVSRRYGSRSLRSDYRIRFRPIDVLIAIGGAIVARVLSGLVALWIEHLNFVHLPVSTNPLVTSSSIPAGGWIVLIVCTCLGAPFFEELFFRGLLQELLLERIGGFLSVALTAAVFATGHIFNAQGLAGVAYAMEILPAGLVLCCIKAAAGRLGSSMLTHLVYNASVLLILAWQVGQLHL